MEALGNEDGEVIKTKLLILISAGQKLWASTEQ